MSGKMPTAPLPAEPLRLENVFLEVRGSPDRIRKAHSACFSFLFFFWAQLGCGYTSPPQGLLRSPRKASGQALVPCHQRGLGQSPAAQRGPGWACGRALEPPNCAQL